MNVRRVAPAIACVFCLACAPALRPPPTVGELAGSTRHAASDVDRLLAEAERAYSRLTLGSVREASKRWLDAAAADPGRVEGLIGAAKAGIWLSGSEPDEHARQAAALASVQAAQLCRQAAPQDPACRYWLALALGVQAREHRTTALDALPNIVKLLEGVAAEAPGLEHGGPHRVLALVLVRAPGWPTGPGDAERGLEEARRAAAVDPDYPPNQLCLGEALAANDDGPGSRSAYRRALDLARGRLDAGDLEAREWLDEAEKGLSSRKGG